MAKVTDRYVAKRDGLVTLCDFSPPRGADFQVLEQLCSLSVDFLCVAYSPGKSVRVDSVVAAYAVKQRTGKDVVFNLATRDMNKLALQSHLLGAQVLGLENLVVVEGDRFSERDLTLAKEVRDFQPTEFLRAVTDMNQGTDYRGLKLKVPTDFCVGAAVDPTKGLEAEARLAYQKVQAGAQFFITQTVYDPAVMDLFLKAYATVANDAPLPPTFVGLPVLRPDGLLFGDVPQHVRDDLAKGRSGRDIALELIHRLVERGVRAIYLVPPILKGGARDYEAVQRVLEALPRQAPSDRTV